MVDRPLERETVEAIEKVRFLAGFLDENVAAHHLQQSETFWENPSEDGNPDRSKLLKTVESASEAIEPLSYDITDWEIRDFPEDDAITQHLDELTSKAFFQQVYGEPEEYRIGLVPVTHLIARQANVVTTAHSEIPTWDDDPLGVVEYSLPVERQQGLFEQAVQTSDNKLLGVQLTSRSPNISVAGLEVRDSDQPMFKNVIFSIRAPPNITNVFNVDGRLILNNGYHRVYQLLKRGMTHVPAVIREMEGVTSGWDFDSGVILGDRPPVVPDFDTEIATTIRKPATNAMIRISAESMEVYR